MGKTTNKHKRLDESWRNSSDANYVKSLSSVAHTFDRLRLKLLIEKGLLPVAEDRRKVTLVTFVTRVIARTSQVGRRDLLT